jgi:hypothetical protein
LVLTVKPPAPSLSVTLPPTTKSPTIAPTRNPTFAPTKQPTEFPTSAERRRRD